MPSQTTAASSVSTDKVILCYHYFRTAVAPTKPCPAFALIASDYRAGSCQNDQLSVSIADKIAARPRWDCSFKTCAPATLCSQRIHEIMLKNRLLVPTVTNAVPATHYPPAFLYMRLCFRYDGQAMETLSCKIGGRHFWKLCTAATDQLVSHENVILKNDAFSAVALTIELSNGMPPGILCRGAFRLNNEHADALADNIVRISHVCSSACLS